MKSPESVCLGNDGHMYVTDEPDADLEVARFLERHSSPTLAGSA